MYVKLAVAVAVATASSNCATASSNCSTASSNISTASSVLLLAIGFKAGICIHMRHLNSGSFRLLPGRFGHFVFGPGLFRPGSFWPQVFFRIMVVSVSSRCGHESAPSRSFQSRVFSANGWFSLGSFRFRVFAVHGHFDHSQFRSLLLVSLQSGSFQSSLVSVPICFGPGSFLSSGPFRSLVVWFRFFSAPGRINS